MSSIMKGLQVDETDKIKGADGKACWKGYRYAGTKKGKDKCVPVKEESDEEALERLNKDKSREKWLADVDLEYMDKRHKKNAKKIDEMPDTSGAVGVQPGGWCRTDMEESRYTDDVMTFAKDLYKEMRREGYDWEPVDLSDPEEAIEDASEQLSMFAHSNMCDAFREYEPEDQIKLLKAFNKKVVKDEDTSYGTGMGQGGSAGESYRKFTPKSAGTFKKESAIMKGLKR